MRTSFDDSSAPLLQHDDREAQYPGNVQFDLEYVMHVVVGAGDARMLNSCLAAQVRRGHNRAVPVADVRARALAGAAREPLHEPHRHPGPIHRPRHRR